MNLEGIMQNEMSQTEKDKYCVISFICGTYKTNKQTPNSQEKRLDLWLPKVGVEGWGIGARWSKGINFHLKDK